MKSIRWVVLLAVTCCGSVVWGQGSAALQNAARMMAQRKYAAAESSLEQTLKSTPQLSRGWVMLGNARYLQGKLAPAYAAFQRAAADESLAGQATYFMAICRADQQRDDEALALLQQACFRGFNNVDLLEHDPKLERLHEHAGYQSLLKTERENERLFVEDARVLRRWLGETAGDEFGWVARAVGDIDGDGVTDFVSTAPSFQQGTGRIYVYSTGTGELLFQQTGQPGERLGNGASAAGDVDADGTPDVLIGAPNANGVGAAYVYSGKTGKQLHRLTGPTGSRQFGYKVAPMGDVDSDGHDDVLVTCLGADGQASKSGAALAFSGKTGEVLFTLQGEATGDQFGSAAAGLVQADAGLVQADATWIAVGAQDAGPGNRGRVYVYQIIKGQPKLRFHIDGDQQSVDLGKMFVAFPGDLNGDGTPDVYASDFLDNSGARGAGKVVLCSGVDGSRLYEIAGQQPGEGLGTSPSDAGDIDGDGVGDLAVGAWQHASGAPSGGRVTLYRGTDGQPLATWTCNQQGDTFGFDSVGIGDVDGDGVGDLLITSAWANVRGARTGRVFVIAGPPRPQ